MLPWTKILRAIANKKVLPIIGPDLSLIQDGEQTIPLRNWLAPRLATRLKIPGIEPASSLNTVACAHMVRGGCARDLYEEVGLMIDELLASGPALPQPLVDLASVLDFDLFVTSSIDPFLGLALERERPGFSPTAEGSVGEFHPTEPADIPGRLPDTYVYHVLGTHNTYPDFGIWEEDYLEFAHGLLSVPKDMMRNLKRHLSSRSLLLIGAPFDDWMVRLFLRIAKKRRLSEQARVSQDYFAEDPTVLQAPMVFYFDQVLKYPRMFPLSPGEFAAELARRWRDMRGGASVESLLDSIPDEPERGSIFLSYSRDDQEQAVILATGLRAAGLPVWLDTKRLQGGTDWSNHIRRAIKTSSCMFLSLISEATERGDADSLNRFVHQERRWAVEQENQGLIFYHPVVITDENRKPRREPDEVAHLNRHHLPGGLITPGFARLMKKRYAEWKDTGRILDI